MAVPGTLEYKEITVAVGILRAANHKLRQTILKLLSENQPMKVTDIYVKLRLEQSVASQHLAILRKAKLVRAERDGKMIFYSLNNRRLTALAEFAENMRTASN